MSVSSFRPSSERMDRLWIVCVYIGCGGAMPFVEKCRFEHMSSLVEEEFFIDSVMVKSAELRDFFFEVFTAFCVSLV